jgi:hypothetical protein
MAKKTRREVEANVPGRLLQSDMQRGSALEEALAWKAEKQRMAIAEAAAEKSKEPGYVISVALNVVRNHPNITFEEAVEQLDAAGH